MENKIYHTVGTVPKWNWKTVEIGQIDISNVYDQEAFALQTPLNLYRCYLAMSNTGHSISIKRTSYDNACMVSDFLERKQLASKVNVIRW